MCRLPPIKKCICGYCKLSVSEDRLRIHKFTCRRNPNRQPLCNYPNRQPLCNCAQLHNGH